MTIADRLGARRARLVAIAAVGVLGLALVTLMLTRDDSPQVRAIPAMPVPAPTTTAPAPVQDVTLRTVNYCFCEAPRGQAQIKIKVEISNLSASPIDLSVTPTTRLYLLVPSLEGWDPPPGTAQPITTVLDGEPVSGVPPNPDGYAEPFGSGQTFATHWSAGVLAPGETFIDLRNREGDLVFYVPVRGESLAILGLAWVEADGTIRGIAPPDAWTGEADPNDF